VLVGGLAVAIVTRAVTLPFDARSEVVLRRYGLSTQTWGTWWVDQAKGFGITTGLLLVVLLAVYGLMRLWPLWWWAPASAAAAVLVIVVSFGYPLVVEPAFNRFTPMPDGPLRSSLLELAERDAVPVRDVLVADASRRTTALNAYVSGFGATRRIVVYDTLLRRADDGEVRSVVAHELGHAKRNDVLQGTLLGALGAAAAVCLISLLISWGPLLRRAGVDAVGDPRSIALFLTVVALLGFATAPAQLLVSRRIEARADVHALELTRDPATFVSMQRRLATQNLSDVDPPAVVYGLFASHPTAPERIAMARTWARVAGVPEPPDAAEDTGR
jgi:STE24 endopeptidase